MSPSSAWPELNYETWNETAETLHMWTQIVGKIRLAQSPWINHGWQVPLYVTARGMSTSTIPHGQRIFQIDFDFVDHRLIIASSDGARKELPLEPRATADFYSMVMEVLDGMDLPVEIHGRPNEVPEPIPFAEDRQHSSYDAEAARRFWQALVQVDRVFRQFRARFIGKCSPVHFFWGSFDMAVTRFSGREAPPHPGGIPNLPDPITREAYSHEVSSAGFWPGGPASPHPIFYSYAYPTPEKFNEAAVQPAEASWLADLGEFILPYDAVRTSSDPDRMLLEFLQSTYDAAADLGKWDRKALEGDVDPRSAR